MERQIARVLYLGNERAKKHVCDRGRYESGSTSLPSDSVEILKHILKSLRVRGSRAPPLTKSINRARSSVVKLRSESHMKRTNEASEEMSSPSYIVICERREVRRGERRKE